MSYDLPNPFLFLSGCQPAENAALVPHGPSVTMAQTGAAPTYRCCPDCGQCEPCDQHCPNAAPSRFQLDEAALMSDIEPVPAFLTRDIRADEIEELLQLARAEEWPAPPRRMVG